MAVGPEPYMPRTAEADACSDRRSCSFGSLFEDVAVTDGVTSTFLISDVWHTV